MIERFPKQIWKFNNLYQHQKEKIEWEKGSIWEIKRIFQNDINPHICESEPHVE